MDSLTTPSLRVSLPAFEGPLDLLLYLVKTDEVDIYDISIQRITQQYLEHLTLLQELDLNIAGDFLVMAAHLIYLKSRSLLPVSQQMSDEEAVDEDDPRWELIRQLVEYKKFKEAAGHLQTCEESQIQIFHRKEPPAIVADTPPTTGLEKVTTLDLIRAFQKVLDRFQDRNRITEIYEEVYTVAQKMEHILDRAKPGEMVVFSSLFGELASRHEIVVTFLAMLELIRLKQIKAMQNAAFDDIEITGI